MKFVIAVMLIIFLAGCGTSKGYVGSNIKPEQLATVSAYSYSEMGLPGRFEKFAILKSGNIEVEVI